MAYEMPTLIAKRVKRYADETDGSTVTTVPRAHVVLQITIFVSCFAFLVKSFNPPWPADVCLRYEINIFCWQGSQ